MDVGLTLPATAFFGPYKLWEQNPIGLRLCNKNCTIIPYYFTNILKRFIFEKKINIWPVTSRINNWRKNKKTTVFFKFTLCFEVVMVA